MTRKKAMALAFERTLEYYLRSIVRTNIVETLDTGSPDLRFVVMDEVHNLMYAQLGAEVYEDELPARERALHWKI